MASDISDIENEDNISDTESVIGISESSESELSELEEDYDEEHELPLEKLKMEVEPCNTENYNAEGGAWKQSPTESPKQCNFYPTNVKIFGLQTEFDFFQCIFSQDIVDM
jgi:hypothetical protein